jgi:mono/diheme cytochrome c family protein
MMRRILITGAALATGGILAVAAMKPGVGGAEHADVERGRYLVTIGGCNDCHTPGYLMKAGNVPEDRWLIGDSVGFSGPWGTTYPSNLRSLLADMSEDDWVRYVRTLETRPPMPWFNLRAFAEDDLRAMHRYIRSLPADDRAVPDYVPPDRQPETPHIVMVPQAPKP